MGCVCAKGIDGDDHVEKKKRRQQQLESQSLKRLVSSSKSDEIAVADVDAGPCNHGNTARIISNSHEHVVRPLPALSVEEEKKEEVAVVLEKTRKMPLQIQPNADVGVKGAENWKISRRIVEEHNLTTSSVPNGFKGEHVAAGWPSWLTSVAGEAVKGWLPRRADSFEKLNKIGQGTYSSVYKARDLYTGKLVALKKVRFVNIDAESVRFMAREIHILRRLEHPNVIKLEALVTSRMSCNLYLVFEYMEHDLAGIAGKPGIRFTESQVKCYMLQLLSGLGHCHSHGVLHRDIKCANLLVDNNGILKIADFGLATFYNPNHKQHLTSRVVTLWYRPPELLLGATEYGVAVDLWSVGCILAELLAGRPIMPGRTEVEQLHKIFKLCGSPSEQYWRTSKLPHATSFKPQQPYPRCIHDTFREFPSSALALLDCLLAVEPAGRGTADSALKSEFFTTKPFACDPSSLPKYPPSKEYDVKLRNEEARRQREAAAKASGSESGRRNEMPVPINVESQRQKTQRNASYNSYNAKEDMSSALPVNPHRGIAENGFSHRARSGHLYTAGMPNMLQGRGSELSITSGPVVARSNTARLDRRESARHLPRQQSGARYSLVDKTSEKQEWTDLLLNGPPLSHKKDSKAGDNEPTVGYDTHKNRIHYSGPLMPPGGNMDEMLKEHERQIQQAVRRTRLDKTKTKGQGQRGLSESLLYASRNGASDH